MGAKKANVFKAKNWSKRGYQLPQPGALIISADNSWSPPLPFHTALKFLNRTYSHFTNMPHPYKHITILDKRTHIHTQTHCHAHRDMYKQCEYVRLRNFWSCIGKVEAVVRNCLLRWSGHLVEVAGTHLFDQPFAFNKLAFSLLR